MNANCFIFLYFYYLSLAVRKRRNKTHLSFCKANFKLRLTAKLNQLDILEELFEAELKYYFILLGF